ncbi:MAG: 23S rRNA (adenine(2030)-N(6))-methyltransferase RlmJ [Proteobacteria bacterium]|nr:23S rRNA (adenine(2030)-N(6))-methyltransferase RlmJ [Pseudomonadota bacterium]
MNYQHNYHAGNFADVLKHAVLTLIIQSLSKKETPFCYLETHAGAGCYDLIDEKSQKTGEYLQGIDKLFKEIIYPSCVKPYMKLIKALNPSILETYPGSPYIAQQLMRKQDHLILCELHADTHQMLRRCLRGDKRIAIHKQDGYLGLKAFLPPKERRGLVFIDPPFEKSDEFRDLVDYLSTAVKRFSNGIYAIWYPIKDQRVVQHFYSRLKKLNIPTLQIELSIHDHKIPLGLSACGMVILNPPWQLDKTCSELLPWLWKALSPEGKGYYKVLLSS